MTQVDRQIVAELLYKCRERGWMVKAQTRLTNQIKAITRTLEAQKLDLYFADTLQKCVQPDIETGNHSRNDTHRKSIPGLDIFIKPLLEAIHPVKTRRKELEKEIESLALDLPVWNEWAKDIRGIGPLGLGLIVGAAGRDLTDYPNPGKLWKRFGLAPGQRRYTDKDKALAAGYSPQRRSLMFNISEALMKQNDGEFRRCYVERKAYLMERSPEWKLLKKPKRTDEEEGNITAAKDAVWKYHQEALRYLAKRFLRDLWKAWRGQQAFEAQFSSASPRLKTGTE